jgi:type II secretory pathway pseudopilin PulG
MGLFAVAADFFTIVGIGIVAAQKATRGESNQSSVSSGINSGFRLLTSLFFIVVKPHFSNQRNHALTLVEVLVVIAVLVLIAAMFLPALANPRRRYSRINCVNNLGEIGVAYRVWAGDNNDKYPMAVSVANGGAMELVATGNVVQAFLVISNELSTPRLLICPQDKEHTMAPNFGAGFTSKNISYFIGLDTDKTNQQIFLSGDDNLTVDDVAVKSGLVQIPANSNVAWTSGRHVSYKEHFWTPTYAIGNIGLADGSVQQDTTVRLQTALQQTGLATNRFAIP